MKANKTSPSNQAIAMKVSVNTIILNVLLSVFKLIAGIVAHSGAMISDSIHSASDVFSTLFVIAGFTISGKASDDRHQYGHERFECVASIILAIILFATGIGIGLSGLGKITAGDYSQLRIPGLLALAAAILSIAVKEGMYWYTRAAARRINSGSLMADAWHHRSDALSSIGSLAGIAGARLGFPILDPIASVVICVFIVKAACDIFKDAVEKMTDQSCDQQTVQKMQEVILGNDQVLALDELKTRMFGSKIYVDIEISADGSQSLYEAHGIAENIHNAIEDNFPLVKHCMVHVNPVNSGKNAVVSR